MKTKILTLIILFVFALNDSYAQSSIQTLRDTVINLQNNNFRLRKELDCFRFDTKQKISLLQRQLKTEKAKTDSLISVINNLTETYNQQIAKLNNKIELTQTQTHRSISAINQTISKNTLYWIIAVLVVVILLLVVFIILRKQIFKQRTDLETNIERTRKALEEEAIKLDNKLIEILETQLKVLETKSQTSEHTQLEPDHSLALKVADEVVRIEKNINRLGNVKGVKPLIKGVERIKANLKANGYEIVELLGKEYNENMNVEVINFIDDETLEEGKRIITKIIKPQVNYQGVLIQRAQVEVTQN